MEQTDLEQLEGYKKDDVSLFKISGLEKDDIIVVKVLKPITQEVAKNMTKTLERTFPNNKVLVVADGADITFITAKVLNNMGWVKKDENKIISLT